jgi:hypothetical protein
MPGGRTPFEAVRQASRSGASTRQAGTRSGLLPILKDLGAPEKRVLLTCEKRIFQEARGITIIRFRRTVRENTKRSRRVPMPKHI